MRPLLVLAFLAPALPGQNVAVGIIGGVSLTRGVVTSETSHPGFDSTRYYSKSHDRVLGAMVEVRLSPNLAVEVDGLHRQLRMVWAGVRPDGTLHSVSPSPVVTWEFPVLAKYRFHRGWMKPFVEAGPSFRTAGNLNGASPSHYGVTAGAGVEVPWREFRIAPVLRYTRWANDHWDPKARPDQLELLVSFSRGSQSEWKPWGGRISMGAVIGQSLTRPYKDATSSYQLPSGTYTWKYRGLRSIQAGPTVEIAVNKALSVEVDALSNPLKQAITRVESGRRDVDSVATWEFPVVAKYRLPVGRTLRPFVEAGPSFRLPKYELSTRGVTAGVGVEMQVWRMKIAPRIRYTHWGAETRGGSYFPRNAAAALVGISF